MHIFGQKQHPLEDIHKWQRKLDRVIQKIQSDIKPDRTGYSRGQVRLQQVLSAASGLRMTVYSALRIYRATGIVLRYNLSSLDFSLRSLKDAVRFSTTNRALRTPAMQPGSIQSLRKIIAKMEAALVRLSHEGVWETKVREQRIRDALRQLDKRLAGADVVSSKEIKEWCSIFPGLELEVSGQIERLATTIWLSRIYDQTWEIRYRSTAPGKPLRLVIACLGFPDQDLLEECYKLCGRPKELYVAATLPRWRVVWKIPMEDFLF